MTPFYLTRMFLDAQYTWDHDNSATPAQLEMAMDLIMMVHSVVFQLSGTPNL